MISVRLDADRCKGCTTCIKQCPTEAIRVRNGRATILKERCIDCGHCVRVCPHHAKVAVADSLDHMEEFKHTIVLPAPSLYAQFHNLEDINIVLQALLDLGFSEIFEPAYAAEIISDLTEKALAENTLIKPVINSACPAVIRLICQRFPNLIPNIMEYMAPVELGARLAKEAAMARTGLPAKDIGVFFISPCPAKVSEAHEPLGLTAPTIDYALSMSEVYLKLLPLMRAVGHPPDLRKAGFIGVGWATSGGESASMTDTHYLAVDGLENVISILENIEDDQLPEVEFLELNACDNGCVGGCLTIENSYVAKARIRRLIKNLPVAESTRTIDIEAIGNVWRTKKLLHQPALILDPDFGKAITKLRQVEALTASLPGLDCGSCGTPGCHALAEDVVMGYAQESDCIFNLRTSMEDGDIDESSFLPPPFRRPKSEE